MAEPFKGSQPQDENPLLDSGEKLRGQEKSILLKFFGKEIIVPLPPQELLNTMLKAKEIGWNVSEIIQVKPNINKPHKRAILLLQKSQTNLITKEITIETDLRGEYTAEFQELVKDFYL